MLTMPHRDRRNGAFNRLLAKIDRYLNDGKAAVGVAVIHHIDKLLVEMDDNKLTISPITRALAGIALVGFYLILMHVAARGFVERMGSAAHGPQGGRRWVTGSASRLIVATDKKIQ